MGIRKVEYVSFLKGGPRNDEGAHRGYERLMAVELRDSMGNILRNMPISP